MALTAMILTYVVFSKREKNTDLDSLTTFILSLDTVLKLIENQSVCQGREILLKYSSTSGHKRQLVS